MLNTQQILYAAYVYTSLIIHEALIYTSLSIHCRQALERGQWAEITCGLCHYDYSEVVFQQISDFPRF